MSAVIRPCRTVVVLLVSLALLSLGPPGHAAAAPSETTTAPDIRVVALKLKPGSTPTRSSLKLIGDVRIEGGDINLWRVETDVTVNGRTVARGTPLARAPQPEPGINYFRRYGAGVVRLTNIRVWGYDYDSKVKFENLALAVPPNSTRVRYHPDVHATRLDLGARKGKRRVLRARAVYRDKHERLRPVRTVVLQRKAPGQQWRKARTVRTNAKGMARIVVRAPKRVAFRLVVRQKPRLAAWKTAPLRLR